MVNPTSGLNSCMTAQKRILAIHKTYSFARKYLDVKYTGVHFFSPLSLIVRPLHKSRLYINSFQSCEGNICKIYVKLVNTLAGTQCRVTKPRAVTASTWLRRAPKTPRPSTPCPAPDICVATVDPTRPRHTSRCRCWPSRRITTVPPWRHGSSLLSIPRHVLPDKGIQVNAALTSCECALRVKLSWLTWPENSWCIMWLGRTDGVIIFPTRFHNLSLEPPPSQCRSFSNGLRRLRGRMAVPLMTGTLIFQNEMG